MAGTIEVPKRLLQKLISNDERNKKAQREAEIKAKVDNISKAGPKRAIAHHLKTLHMLDDIDDVWEDIFQETRERDLEAEEVGGQKVPWVRIDNMEEVEKAIFKQGEFLKGLRDHAKYELGMQTVGAKNKFGFKLVAHKEQDPDFDKKLLSFDEDDVRGWEKAYVQRERECSL